MTTADVGDDYTIRTIIKVDDVETDPASVAIEITPPLGSVTNPTPTNPAVGQYDHIQLLDEPGRWRWTWTTTLPAGVDHGFIDVTAAPPDRLDPLATVGDIESTLGRDLTEAEAKQARGLLLSASRKIRTACNGQVFSRVLADTVILRPVQHELILPQRPVTGVTSVAPIDTDGTPGVTITGWAWDGSDKIRLTSGPWWVPSYQVVYDHGYVVMPDTLVDVCVDAAMRVLTSPTVAEGATMVTVGQVSQQFQQAAGAVGSSPRLTRADERALVLGGFKRTAATIQVSP